MVFGSLVPYKKKKIQAPPQHYEIVFVRISEVIH